MLVGVFVTAIVAALLIGSLAAYGGRSPKKKSRTEGGGPDTEKTSKKTDATLSKDVLKMGLVFAYTWSLIQLFLLMLLLLVGVLVGMWLIDYFLDTKGIEGISGGLQSLDPSFLFFLAVFLALAAYGAYKNGTGKGALFFFTYPAGALVMMYVLASLLFGPDATRNGHAELKEWANNEVGRLAYCNDHPDDPACQSARSGTEEEVVMAGSSGNIIAPVTDWSEWRKFRKGSCFRVWTANPDVQDVRVRFQNAEGDVFRNMDNEEYMNDTIALSVRSDLGAPVRVSYEIWDKVPGQRCRKA